MTMAPEVSSEKKFVPATLPWLVAAGAFLLYLLTLNHWVSFNSLGPVARLSGWTWQTDLGNPLYWLLTYPLRWLPAKLIPLALNGFSALCAVLTLALLARSIALLPHNRTEDQRARETSAQSLLSIRLAWLPPLLAVLVCGLQLTFWEHATAASSEMLDLLLFAYVVRSVLEFRLDRRDSWLFRAVLVYGLGMTNNWAMIGFFPAFVIALIWVKGLKFFNLHFLGRMALWGLAGLALYLVLPLVASLSQAHVSFWQALKYNLASQKQLLFALPFNKIALLHGFDGRPLWVLALPSLLPVLVLGIRWPSYFGDPSKLGVALTTFIFHVVHGVLLLVCLWVALDPQSFSPRHLLPLPLLTFYYLGALSIGYFAGYFLLVFGVRPATRMGRQMLPGYWKLVNLAVLGAIWTLAVVTPALLLYKNLPQIRTTNGPLLKQYAAQVAASLPAQGAMVLSDDPRRLLLLQSALTQGGKAQNYVFLDTSSLVYPDYHRFLKKQYPQRWPIDLPKDFQQPINPSGLANVVASLTQSNSLYYLHPSFGYYFELLYPEPHGLVYKLNLYPPNTLLAPPLSPQVLAENEAFWDQADHEALPRLNAAVSAERKQRPLDRFLAQAHLPSDPNTDATILASFYSRALDLWGVQLQKADQLAQAAARFERALNLNPENLVAQINLEYNGNLRAKLKGSVQLSQSIEDKFGKYRNWDQIVGANGPFDEPSFCYEQGRAYARSGNYRQAAHEFTRVKKLVPDNLSARLYLAQISLMSQMPDAALQEVQTIQSELASACQTNFIELLSIQASAHLVKNDTNTAHAVVQTAMTTYPTNAELLATLAQVYMNFGLFPEAQEILDRQIKLQPKNPEALINKGYACLQMKAYQQAVAPLTLALSLETNNTSEAYYRALFNRAIAYLQSDDLDRAQKDYEVLQKAFTNAFRVYYGLGEVAYRKKDKPAAIKNYQSYLANAPTNTEEATNILARLQELQRGSP